MGMPIIQLSVDELDIIRTALRLSIDDVGIEDTPDKTFQVLGRIISKIEELTDDS